MSVSPNTVSHFLGFELTKASVVGSELGIELWCWATASWALL